MKYTDTIGRPFRSEWLSWLAAAMALVSPAHGDTIYVSGPSTNASPLRLRAISAGQFDSLGVQSNGTAATWGYNIDFGHTGLPNGLSGVIALAGGDNHSLALKTDGTVVAWGDDSYGQTNVPNGLNGVVAIAAQAGHSLAIRTGGYLAAWGDNTHGQSYIPGDLFGGVLAIAAGDSHNLAIRSDHTVEAWGANTYGQCNVPDGLSNVVAIAAGWQHSLALRSDGTVVAWGSSVYDETNVPSGLGGVTAIASFWANCAALKSDGTVVTWGANHSAPPGLNNVVAIATGSHHDLALRYDGSVAAWDDGRGYDFGQTLVPGASVTDHNISDAVSMAKDGDTIMVAPGQYNLTNQVVITKAILLKGTMGAGQTLLNLGFGGWGVWVSNSAAVIDGFTLQAMSDPTAQAGIFLVGGTVQNCHFTNFWTVRQGAAISMTGGIFSNSIVSYQRFDFEGSAVSCSAGGLVAGCQILGDPSGRGADGDGVGVYLVGSQLRNTQISGLMGAAQKSSGQALYAVSSTIVGCTIAHNANSGQGGGAYLNSCLMDRCIVSGNTSRGEDASMGGGGIFETNSIIRNSLIVSNNADENVADPTVGGLGGGVYMQGGALINCTVADNGAFSYSYSPPNPSPIGHGAGVYVQSGGLTNCIIYSNYFYGNAASDNEWYNAGIGIFDHICTTPNPGGVGNVIQDPRFVDLANGNFHLATNSPCVRAGVAQGWMSGAFGLDGNPRTFAGAVDMGAYETPSATSQPALRIFATASNTVVIAWPASAAGYVLEQNPGLRLSGWTAPEGTATVVNGENQLTVAPVAGGMLYRLRRQ